MTDELFSQVYDPNSSIPADLAFEVVDFIYHYFYI